MSEERAKSVRREATLYSALDGAGAPRGRSLEALREAALAAYEALPLPVWRRSGFWTTSFADLDLDALEVRHHSGTPGAPVPGDATSDGAEGAVADSGALPPIAQATLPQGPRAGRIVQLDGSVVHCELSDDLRARGVVLCTLEHAALEHPETFERWYASRTTIDRHKLEAANAAFWTGGAFLHIPSGVSVQEPFEIVHVVGAAGVAQHARVLIVGEQGSEFRVHEYGLAEQFAGQALHTETFELYLQQGARCRLAHFQDWGGGEVYDSCTRFVGVGRDAHCHWLPALLGGHLVHEHLELAVSEPGGDMAYRGIFFTEAHEQLDVFAVDLHETGPSGGDVHWRGAAAGHSRASMEGLIKINPGAQ
ncbi:MAG: SufD family Fe-S cluster assembly protein, partial [Solirubrobacteraceae bacterium]